jgi:2-polyprenyl-3-methyl-5-hydroxy-6-metoxy-1,4-benzoquinol methylase
MPNNDIATQTTFWNKWNSHNRELTLDEVSVRHRQEVCRWIRTLGRTDLRILEVGCGAGWLCSALAEFGTVVGTDLADEVLARARARWPQISFVPGDFMDLDLGRFDVVVTVEVLSHVKDQAAFVAKLASHLRPGGLLVLATQNRPVLENYHRIAPPQPGQLRHWVDRDELRALLSASTQVVDIYSVVPRADFGLWRWIHSRKLNALLRRFVGDRIERAFEARDMGWSLIAVARSREASEVTASPPPGRSPESAPARPNAAP